MLAIVIFVKVLIQIMTLDINLNTWYTEFSMVKVRMVGR